VRCGATSKQQVLAASAAKSRFLAATSHDLRQPVHAISLYVGALARFVKDDEGLRILQRLQGSVRSLDGLFEALQDISKIDAGVVPVQRRAIPVRQLFEAMDVQFRAAAELKGLTLDIDPTPVVIESDRAQLERILANFVSNAIRYTREGSVRLRAVDDGEFAVLSVRDTGAGIAPEDREAIFEEFVQLGNPERDRNKGLGLGLAIVRRLADLLGHSVALDSAPGRGSEFAVRVPRVRVDAAFEAAEPQTQPPTADTGQLPGSFVLVIDDERDVLDAMTIVLEQAGAYVLTAGSGAEAVEKISREDRLPDVVVSDLRLRGGETGILAVSRVREAIGEPVPALLVTGDTAPERVAEAAASGLVLLHKPLRPERLTAALSLALAST
jgi:CheY-like chemotaxis protein/two-component sensor histidine kinase